MEANNKLTVVRCVKTWNFAEGIPKRPARKLLALTGWEAQLSAMNRGNLSTRNINHANARSRSFTLHPIILCPIGIGGFQPVIVVFAAERCIAPTATRLVSEQGNVTWSTLGNAALAPAKLNDLLCARDTVRLGTKSRAVLRLPNETIIPLDQNTVFQLKQPISEKEPIVIERIQGAIHVITRALKPFKVNTPFMNAAVDGTEFYVGVDSEEARVAVIEGKVNVSNEQGALLLTDNEAATARQGQAPQKTLTIKPRDAMQWALYYSPLFDPRSRRGAQNLSASYDLYSQGKITDAIERLNTTPEAERSADFYSYRAGLLLLVGSADEAEPDIERALKENANHTDAPSLKAAIAIVQNDKVKALELANRAVSIDDQSAPARIALSYALRAHFKIEDALQAAGQATERDTNSALALVRAEGKSTAQPPIRLQARLARAPHTHAAGLYASGVPVVLAGDYNVVPTEPCRQSARQRFHQLNHSAQRRFVHFIHQDDCLSVAAQDLDVPRTRCARSLLVQVDTTVVPWRSVSRHLAFVLRRTGCAERLLRFPSMRAHVNKTPPSVRLLPCNRRITPCAMRLSGNNRLGMRPARVHSMRCLYRPFPPVIVPACATITVFFPCSFRVQSVDSTTSCVRSKDAHRPQTPLDRATCSGHPARQGRDNSAC